MNNVLLISEKILKENTLINNNVGSEYILPAIRAAQDMGVQNIIGTQLFNKLKSLISDGSIKQTENEAYKVLLDDYIVPYLEWKVMSDIQLPLAFKMRNSGITQTNNEHQTNTVMKDAQTLSTFYDQKATFYSHRLSDYLLANQDLYPEYLTWNNISDMKANAGAYNTGIYLGKPHTCEWYRKASVIQEGENKK
jgi:hypothetical protein